MDYNYNHIAGIQRFRFWCQKVLPAVYDDSLTYYELLCKVIDKLNELIAKDNEQSEVINLLAEELNELKGLFEQFMESGFDDYYADQVEKWINDNLEFIYEHTIRQVYFGLTLDGHFVAYIPDSWSDIIFDTGYDYSLDTYGRLILRWDVDSPDNVDQTPEVVRPYDDAYLREQIINIMNTLYSTEGV